MRIYIPTKGRISNQLTIANLPDELKSKTSIVAPQSETFFHRNNHPLCEVIPQPDPKMGIAEKRKWIMGIATDDKIVMLDDDLRFAMRREDDPGKFRKAEPADVLKAFAELEEALSEEIPHAGFSVRGSGIGDAAKRGGWQTTGKRMIYSLGYHVPTVKEHAIFGRIENHEDMDICLQLLTKGFPNAVNFSFVTDQAFGKAGGCTDERTVESNNVGSYRLAELFPDYVKVSEKDYKASVPRIEVVVQWQKALQFGLNRKP